MHRLYKFFNPLISLFIPSSCIFCNEELPSDRRTVCASCYQSIPRLSSQLRQTLTEEIDPRYFDSLFVVFEFTRQIQELIHLLKYRRFLTLAEYFARSIAACVSDYSYDVVTAVPLNTTRQRERGYNQSGVIAKHLAKLLSVNYDPHLLIRLRNTVSQTRLTRQERIRNVYDAFVCERDVKGMSVLVLDDVITTGSTLNECSRVLRNKQVKRVDVAAVATPASILQHKLERSNQRLDML